MNGQDNQDEPNRMDDCIHLDIESLFGHRYKKTP